MIIKKDFCKFSLIILLLTISTIKAGKIVLLRGISCAEKNMLLEETIKLSEENHGISDDKYFREAHIQRWQELFPKEYSIIKEAIGDHACNIFHAILWGKPLFKDKITEDQKHLAKQAIKKIRRLSNTPEIKEKYKISELILPQYHKEIRDALGAGKTVFIDSWLLEPENYKLYELEGHKVSIELAYCDLKIALKRLAAINNEADQNKDNTNRRYVRQLLEEFYNDFTLAFDHSTGKNIKNRTNIEGISKQDLEEIFESAGKIIKNNKTFKNHGLFSKCELTKESLEQLKQNIINKFGFDELNVILEDAYISYNCVYNSLMYTNMVGKDTSELIINHAKLLNAWRNL